MDLDVRMGYGQAPLLQPLERRTQPAAAAMTVGVAGGNNLVFLSAASSR